MGGTKQKKKKPSSALKKKKTTMKHADRASGPTTSSAATPAAVGQKVFDKSRESHETPSMAAAHKQQRLEKERAAAVGSGRGERRPSIAYSRESPSAAYAAAGFGEMITATTPDGAELTLCQHEREYCQICCVDYRELNEMETQRARLNWAALDATAPERAEFKPRKIVVDWVRPIQYYDEYAPGTRVRMEDWSGREPPEPLEGTIVETIWDSSRDPMHQHPITRQPLPCYRMDWDGGDGHLMPCYEVYDEQFSVLSDPSSRSNMSEDEDECVLDMSSSDASSVATSMMTAKSTLHGRARFEQRDVPARKFQEALKHVKRSSWLPATPHSDLERRFAGKKKWLIVYDDFVFCTDDEGKVKISAWPNLKPGDRAMIKGISEGEDRRLNGRQGILKSWGGVPGVDPPRHGMLEPDGKWEIELELDSGRDAETVRVMLRNVKPAPLR